MFVPLRARRALCGSRDVDDEAQAERGERRLQLFHSRSVTRVEHAADLRQVPAKPARELRILGAQQRLVSTIAFGDRFRHVAERDREAAIGIGGQSRRIKRAFKPHSRPSCFLMAARVPRFRSGC
jgi:hypothetical protein